MRDRNLLAALSRDGWGTGFQVLSAVLLEAPLILNRHENPATARRRGNEGRLACCRSTDRPLGPEARDLEAVHGVGLGSLIPSERGPWFRPRPGPVRIPPTPPE